MPPVCVYQLSRLPTNSLSRHKQPVSASPSHGCGHFVSVEIRWRSVFNGKPMIKYQIIIVFFQPVWKQDMGDFQIITRFWFFRLSFRFYPKNPARICGQTLPQTQIRELWEIILKCCMPDTCVRQYFFRLAISTVSARDIAHIMGWNAPYHALKWAVSDPQTGIIRTGNELFRSTLQGILKDRTVRNGLCNAISDILTHLFSDFILSKKSQEKL